MTSNNDDDDYFLPSEDQRVFGAGLKRKRVAFVPSSSADTSFPGTRNPSGKVSDISSRYLAIVLPEASGPSQEAVTKSDDSSTSHNDEHAQTPSPSHICPTCNLTLPLSEPSSTAHEASIAHQVAMTHSHPPSHLDRQHVGLKYLSAYGWDPDSRAGLGRSGSGIRIPIKGKEKKDTVGIGHELASLERRSPPTGPVKRLNAKQVRKMEAEDKKRRERLQRMFNQSDDVTRYLQDNG